MQDKKSVRSQMRSRYQDFLVEGSENMASERVWSQVESLEIFQRAKCILIYMSIPGEVISTDFINRWYGKKRFVLPKVQGDILELKEYQADKLVRGYKDILEPSEHAPSVSCKDIELALIPGVAFARKRDGKIARLGRGGGFYDRLLPEIKCCKIGICFPFRVVEDLPLEPHDISLDLLCDGV